jgi:hypothetical protein
VLAQRSCGLCGETFEFERKRGGQRKYCFECEPPGFQLVRVPNQDRLKVAASAAGVPSGVGVDAVSLRALLNRIPVAARP